MTHASINQATFDSHDNAHYTTRRYRKIIDDTVAWVTRTGGLAYHPLDGPDSVGRMINASPPADATLISGDWDA